MSTHPRLVRRANSAVYYFRAKIPADLQHHFLPKREICFSLRTRDPAEAIHKVRLESARLEAEFTSLRKRYQLQSEIVLTRTDVPATRPLARLTDEQIQRICALWTRSVLLTDDANREADEIDDEHEELERRLAETEKDLRHALGRGRFEIIEPALHSFLNLLGWDISADTQEHRRLSHSVLKTMVQTVQYQQERLAGGIVEADTVAPEHRAHPLPTKQVNPDEDLMAVYHYWRDLLPDRPRRTCAAFEAVMRELGNAVPNKTPSDFTRKDLIAWRDQLSREVSPATVQKKLSAVRAMFQAYVDADKLPLNPAGNVKISKPKVDKVKRLPYDADDMKRIFGGPVYARDAKLPKAAGEDAARWLPVLALYTGARLEELAQLQLADIKQAEGLGYYLDITELSGEDSSGPDSKRLKTTASRRRVPLHPELIRAGFLRYVDRCRNVGHTRVFQAMAPDRMGALAGNWSKWWGRYSRKTLGIESSLKVFHSTRHSFKAACRSAGLQEEMHDALTGHTNGSVGRSYGGQYPLEPLFTGVARITYPVKLPVIEP